MARPRAFDEALALDRAMDVFWRNGYESTSTDDLMQAMGIGRGSFYNAFGSKRDVYLRTLDRYLEILRGGGPYRALFELEPGADALQGLIHNYVANVAGEGGEDGAQGCYFVHAAKEHRGEDREVKRAIQKGIGLMRGILAQHIEVAQTQGALPDHLDAERTALLMMAVAWGSHVLLEAGVACDEALSMTGILFELNGAPETS